MDVMDGSGFKMRFWEDFLVEGVYERRYRRLIHGTTNYWRLLLEDHSDNLFMRGAVHWGLTDLVWGCSCTDVHLWGLISGS